MKEHLKDEFLQAFNQAINDSNITKTEIAWSLMVGLERLDNIINGNGEINTLQELEIHRFIFKTNYKKRQENEQANDEV